MMYPSSIKEYIINRTNQYKHTPYWVKISSIVRNSSKKTLISNPPYVSFVAIKDTNNDIVSFIPTKDTNKPYVYVTTRN